MNWVLAATAKLFIENYWREFFYTLLILAAGWAAAQTYLILVGRVFRRIAQRTSSTLDDHVWHAIRIPGALLIYLLGVYAAIHRYTFRYLGFIDSILYILAVATILYAAIEVIGVLLEWYGEKISGEKEGETLARELLPLVDKIVKIVVIGIGLMVVLDHYNVEARSILVTLGVGSLAIGLALQDTLANMFGGFTIMIDRPFRIGDRIQLQSGEQGDVRSIGIRATNVMMPDGNLLIIPNSQLVKNMLINCSYPDARCRVVIDLQIAHTSDPDVVKSLLLASAAANERVLRDPAPIALIKSLGEDGITISLVCFAKTFLNAGQVRDEIFSKVRAGMKEAGIEIAFPTQIVRVTNVNPQVLQAGQ
jgi:MscS family membrane protein